MKRRLPLRALRTLALAAPLLAAPVPAPAQTSAPARPEPLATEESDVAVLPPGGPHRVWLEEVYSGQTQIVDGDTGDLLASVYAAPLSTYASAPDQSALYVAESLWTKGNRGDRLDMVTVYDGRTLKLRKEIPLPGRIYMSPTPGTFVLNADGRTGFVYNMQPAASVVMVDLARMQVLRSFDTPGCALIYPWGEGGLSLLCGNGALGTVTGLRRKAAPTLALSKPFFDPEHDPVFQASPSDAASGRALFITYSGVVHPVQLGPEPRFDPAWSLSEAADLDPASLKDGVLAWRPGGRMPFALHRASGRLYVLMHAGEPWTHKKEGTELWVVDTRAHKVVRRMSLPTPVNAVAVSQDAAPLLYLADTSETLSIRNAQTLEELRKIEKVRLVVPVAPGS